MRVRFTFAVVVCMVSATMARAQSADPHDQLIDFATIESLHDLCGFDLSDEQHDLILKQRQKLVDDGAVAEGDIGPIQSGILASLTRQVQEGLCRADGPEARFYKRKLSEAVSP